MMRNSSGNVLVYILIAVAMLAGLSYAVTQGGRGGDDYITGERARAGAMKLLDYTNALANAVTQLTLRGCDETQISFDNQIDTSRYNNALAPSDESCNIFSLNGGGVQYDEALDVIYTGDYKIGDVGTGEMELMADIRTSQSVCIKINEILGVDNTGADGPPVDKLSAGDYFDGSYGDAGAATSNQLISSSELKGRSAGCRVNSGTGDSAIYRFHKALLIR